jgi:Bacterial regulatory proteins, lacI family
VAAPDPSRVLVACETSVLGSTVGPHLRRVNVFVKVLDRHLEAASLSRIRSKAMMDRASKYFELLGVMTMCRPCSTGGAATEKECSRDQGPPPHPGNVATAAGVSLATVSRCLTTEQMSRPRHAHGCSGYWSSTTMCHLAHQWSASSAGGRRLIDLVFTALDSPYSVEILRGVTSSPMDVVVVDAGPFRLAAVVKWTRLRRTVRGHHLRFLTEPVRSTHPRPRSRFRTC